MKTRLFFPIIAFAAMMLIACEPSGKGTEEEKDIAVAGVSLDLSKGVVTTGETITLKATVGPVDATNQKVTWSSDDTAIATVDDGVVTGVKAGSAMITVTTEDGGFTDECVVEVLDKVIVVTNVSLDETEATIETDSTLQLTATVLPRDATNLAVEWSSDNEDVATVDQNGLVNALMAGTATITVTTEDGGLTATCVLTVEMGEHPVFGIASFATDKTWVTGSLTWSDAVVATRCQKEDYDGGVYGGPFNVDCRKSAHGDMFSWEAVSQNQDFLCPGEWRVPTNQDFCDLDKALNGGDSCVNRNNNWDSLANYTDPEKWDARYTGYAYDGRILNEGVYGYFWSISSAEGSGSAIFLGIYDNQGNGTCMTHPNASGGYKYLGMSLRCVK